MPTEIDYYEFRISEHFLSALINDDRTGLSDDNESALDNWLDNLELPTGHWDIVEDSNDFKTCEITKLFSEVIELRWIIMS